MIESLRMLPCIFFWISILIIITLGILDHKSIAHTLLLFAGLCMFLFPDSVHKIFGEPLDDSIRRIYWVLGVMILFSGAGFLAYEFLPYDIPRIFKILPSFILALAGFLFFLLVIHILTR